MRIFFCLFASFVSFQGHAQTPSAPPTPAPQISLAVEKYKLENGLTVILHEDHTVPMVSYHTWYRVGSRDEKPGVTGAAHMLEHMMFKGAEKYSGKDFDRILHENGIINNAFTTWDYTGFYENLPSHRLELIMDMEVDRMKSLALKPEDLKSELEVVKEERRSRVDNNPMGLLRESLYALAFPKNPYGWPVIGTMKDITDYTPEKLRHFYDSFYGPNNAVLVIAGDIQPAQVKKWIEKYYGKLKPREVPPRDYPNQEMFKVAKRKVLKSDVQSSTVLMAYPTVPAGHPDSYALDLLASLMGSGDSSRLNQSLVYEARIATSASSSSLGNQKSGLFLLSGSLNPESSSELGENFLRREVHRLKQKPPTEKELEKAKNQFMKGYLDGLMTIDGRAQALAVNEIVMGNHENLFTDLAKYQAVSLEDLQRVIREYFRPERQMVVILEPKQKPAETLGVGP